MKRKTVSPVGALHPVLFFAGVYVVALFFSIFICSSIFYSCNTSDSKAFSSKNTKTNEVNVKSTVVATLK